MHAVITKRNKPVTSTRWTGKWSNGVPTPTTNAYIDTDYTTATGSFACRDLIVTASAVLTIPENTYVKVLKDINQTTTSHIIVKAGGELMLLNVDADVTTARLTAEATYKNLQRLDYAFISSPISGIPVKRLSPGTLDNRFYINNEETNLFNVINPNTRLTIGCEGYHIRTPNLHPLIPTDLLISVNNFSGGHINKGNISIPVHKLKTGYNLVGNPYNARLSLRKFYEVNKDIINTNMSIWKKTNGAQGNSYIFYNTIANNSENSNINILPFQAFMIQINNNKPFNHVVFTTDMIIKYDDFSSLNQFHLNLFQKDVNFHLGSVCYNSKKFNSIFQDRTGDTHALSILSNNMAKIINQDLEFNINTVIQLKLVFSEISEYALKLKDISGIFSSLSAINLYDSLTNTIHNLKISDYTFTSEAGTFDNRFSITFQ